MHTKFLGTTTYPMDDSVRVYIKHKYRPWGNRQLYRIARGGGARMRHVLSLQERGVEEASCAHGSHKHATHFKV